MTIGYPATGAVDGLLAPGKADVNIDLEQARISSRR